MDLAYVVQYNQISQFWVGERTDFGQIRPDDTEWPLCVHTTTPQDMNILYMNQYVLPILSHQLHITNPFHFLSLCQEN